MNQKMLLGCATIACVLPGLLGGIVQTQALLYAQVNVKDGGVPAEALELSEAPINPPIFGKGFPELRYMPGKTIGRSETRWIGPYVIATQTSLVSPTGWLPTTTIRWFNSKGEIVRKLSGAGISADQRGYISVYTDGINTIYGVNEDWKLVLPKDSRHIDSYMTATEDSRTFIHEFHPKEGQIVVDIYILGKLVNTVGPLIRYSPGTSVHLGMDGSVSFFTWKTPDKKDIQVVVIGPDGTIRYGTIRFQVDCDEPYGGGSIVAPDGIGVLVEYKENTFTFYQESGRVASLKIEPNPHFVGWVPGTSTALFSTSLDHKHRYQLIDWSTGRKIWDIPIPPIPPTGHSHYSTYPLVEKDYILISGLEFTRSGDHEVAVRSIYAVDTETGELKAHWLPSPIPSFSMDGGRFLGLGEKLYFITKNEISEINREDIVAKKNGWK